MQENKPNIFAWILALIFGIASLWLWETNRKIERRVNALNSNLLEIHERSGNLLSKIEEAKEQLDSLKSHTEDINSHIERFGTGENWRAIVPDLENEAGDIPSELTELEEILDRVNGSIDEINNRTAPIDDY